MENFTKLYGFMSTVLSLPFEPVVGGLMYRAVFFLVACAVIGMGLSTVIVKATGEWKEKVTEISTGVLASA